MMHNFAKTIKIIKISGTLFNHFPNHYMNIIHNFQIMTKLFNTLPVLSFFSMTLNDSDTLIR